MVKGKLKVSRNKKSTWRKHVDITEIEEFEEEKRFEERTGIKDTDPLFVIEKTAVKETNDAVKPQKGKTGLKSTKDIVGNLSCYKSLKITNKTEPMVSRLQPRKEEKIPKRLLKPKVKATPKAKSKFYDIWEDEQVMDEDMKDLEVQQKMLIGKNKLKTPARILKRTSFLPPVEVPLPGASYNPTLEDHQELLSKAIAVELDKKKFEEKTDRMTSRFYAEKPTPEEAKANWFMEMSQGLAGQDSDDDEAEKVDEEEHEMKTSISRGIPKPKNKAKKKREKLLKRMKDWESSSKKHDKSIDQQINSLKSVKKAVKKEEEKSKATTKKRLEAEKMKMFGPQKLGPVKFEEAEIEVNLSHDIRGSLREVKVEGCLLRDRMKSYQKRNIIEPRLLSLKKHKGPRTKLYTIRGHRDGDV
ncbi:hypothetical protein HDE_02592 [Halotydeus destructor]|nr:hypothetical protein HDE_02592 [Halotydeus destructor]